MRASQGIVRITKLAISLGTEPIAVSKDWITGLFLPATHAYNAVVAVERQWPPAGEEGRLLCRLNRLVPGFGRAFFSKV